MDVNTMKPEELQDLFSSGVSKANPSKVFSLGATDVSVDILDKPVKEEDKPLEDDKKPAEDVTTKKDEGATDDKKTELIDTDLLGGGTDDKKPGRKPKYDFTDTSGYFQDRFKSGKFVKVRQEGEDGKITDFIPTTPEEFDEVIELQVDHRLSKKEKELAQNWYQSKSPAWQAVARYAEMVDNPADVIPFIQGVRTIESVKDIDETTIEGAESIVRTRLEQKGDTPELIEKQIQALKTTENLLPTAKAYKPMIMQEEQRNLTALAKDKELKEQEALKDVLEVEKNALKVIETPFFGKKLPKEEKALIYDLIGYPSEELGGYKIFAVLDTLFAKRDFDTLREVALLLAKKDSYHTYATDKGAQAAATGLRKKLTVATEGSASGDQDLDDETPVIHRHKFTSNFGR